MNETRGRGLLKNINPQIVCYLCQGYYIDPTTIVECLHTFCRSCIIKFLDTSDYCPKCDVRLHKNNSQLSLRRDKQLEQIVYKIVPGLYAKEMAQRKSPRKKMYLSPDDLVSLVLQYHMGDDSSQTTDDEKNCNAANQDLKSAHRKFLQCPAAVTVEHLKKFLILKYSLTDQHQVEIIHASECLTDDFSLMDVAYCFNWKQTSPMELSFQILEKSTVAIPIVEEVESVDNVDMDEDNLSVTSSSLPFLSSKSLSECDDASNTSLDSKPLFERLKSEKIYRKRKRGKEISDDEPEEKKSLFDSLLTSTTSNNNENEDKDFQDSDDDYSKYEQDIEEIIEEDDDDDIGRLRISSNVSEDEINNDETTSQMFVIDEAIEEEKYEKVTKEKHWKPKSQNKKKNKKAKHHHHHKRRLSESPPPSATIVHSPDRDIMKLKVKLNTLPGYRHKDDKHHKHTKHYNGSASSASSIMSSPSRSSYKEDDSVLSEQSCDSIILPKKSREKIKSQTEKQSIGDVRKSQTPKTTHVVGESCKSDTLSKESLPQMRAVRPKPKPVDEQQSNTVEPSHKMIIMPPSSITVSIITAEEKLKMEMDKTLMLTGNHDFENKRPSLEIVRVNGPPTSPPSTPVEISRASPKPKEIHEERAPTPTVPRPKTKKPVPAVIPLKSAKPSITITPQSRSPSTNNNNNSNGMKQDEIKTSVTISLENGSQNDSALDLSGKSSRKDVAGQQYAAVNHKSMSSSAHVNGGGQYEPSGMRNLMTLSDTAVQIRNMMSSSKEQQQQQQQQPQQQQQQQQQQQYQQQQNDVKKRFGHNNNNNHVSNGNVGSGVVNNGSCSPKRHNGSVPLRIPVPPSSGSFGNKTSAAAAQNKPVKITSRASDTKPKHGPPNQAVRHIPNPSVLLFRHHQQHLAQFAAAAAAAAANAQAAKAQVANNNNNNNNKRPNNSSTVANAASKMPSHSMPPALPLHTIRKMENMTKNIEKVAAGLSVKANALYKQNFIENGRARLELPG